MTRRVRMKASASDTGLEWNTAIWFNKKRNNYLLPIKADIRNKAPLKPEEMVSVSISI